MDRSRCASGTAFGTLVAAYQLVQLPTFADQYLVAGHVAASPAAVGRAVETVLTDPAYRSAAEQVSGRPWQGASPEGAVELLLAQADRHR